MKARSTPDNALSRRRFLQVLAGGAGALIVGIPSARAADAANAASAPIPLAWLGDPLFALDAFVRVDADGSVLIGARDPDTGTGVATALPRIIADEMDADWGKVKVVALGLGVSNNNGKPRWTYGRQIGGTGTSIPVAWNELRGVGALARWLLLQAAAAQWKVPASQLRCAAGMVTGPNGKRLDFGSLAKAAAKIKPPAKPVPLKTPDRFTLIGQPAGDVDATDIVTGRTAYVIDHHDADALVAVLVHCPWPDGSLKSIDTEPALKIKGVVKIVQLKPEPGQPPGQTVIAPAVAVVAESTWLALQGRDALKLEWEPGPSASQSSAALEQQGRDLVSDKSQGTDQPPVQPTARVRDEGDVDAAGKQAARRIDATYVQPWLAHACAETMNCSVRLEKNRAVLVVPTQAPQAAWQVVQRLTGLKPEQIEIQVPRVGGGYGRRLQHDFVAEAVLIAKAVNKPVSLFWTREQDVAHDYFTSGCVYDMHAIIGRKRELLAWRQRMASASSLVNRGVPDDQLWRSEISPNQLPAGLIENFRSDWFGQTAAMPRGPMRGMPDVHGAFAAESFIDEIAHQMRENPLDTRQRLLGEPRQIPLVGGGTLDTGRLANVLKLVAERIDWSRWLHTVNGLGMACWHIDGAYVAHAIEVSMTGKELTVVRAVCAADIGRVINPLGLEGQLAGATLAALSTTLHAAITIKKGQVQQQGWKDYTLATMPQLPNKVETIVVADNDRPPTGASLIALPTVAPALANAVFRATAVRVRRLPLMPELLRLR